jgi:hypothetical protein
LRDIELADDQVVLLSLLGLLAQAEFSASGKQAEAEEKADDESVDSTAHKNLPLG